MLRNNGYVITEPLYPKYRKILFYMKCEILSFRLLLRIRKRDSTSLVKGKNVEGRTRSRLVDLMLY